MAKLTTAEILALARKQDSGGKPAETSGDAPENDATTASDAPAASSDDATEQPSASSESTQSEGPTKPGPRPSSTKDILARARAEAAGGGKPAEAKTGEKESPKDTPAETSPKPAGGARPKSTKDILAAARAQAGSGAAEKSEAKPPSKTQPQAKKPSPQTAAKPSAAQKPGGERPSVEEMLRRARSQEEQAAAREAESKPARPPLPKRPAPAAPKAGKRTRRSVLTALLAGVGALVATPFAAGWTAFTTALAAATTGFARFMMPNVIVVPPSQFKIGPPDDYPLGTVTTKWKSEYAIWITHQVYKGEPVIYALSTVCTHLGCTPNWLEGEQKFKCPCHGSGFYPDGINFEGPAPRPLERYGISLASDGMLEVDKSVKFQEELGQWQDPASYVATG